MGNAKILEKKKEGLKQLVEKINSARVLILADYCKLTVKEITDLRRMLRTEGSEYNVVKNTLLKRAVDEIGFSNLKEYLEGPTALLLGYKDPISPLKVLVKFVKEIEKGSIKAAVIEKAYVDKEQIQAIAKLPSREDLIAKVVLAFKSPMFGLVNVLQGNLRSLVYVLNSIREKKGGEK